MALKGTLTDFGIPDILQLIGQQQKTGTLHLKAGAQEVRITFRDGAILRAETAQRRRRDLIGRMLVQAELITEEQLEVALETQRRTLARLGDVIVSMNMLPRARFEQMMNLQTTETLYGLFAWKSGTYEFEQGEVDAEEEATPIRAESVLMEGFRMVDEWPHIKRVITSFELCFEKLKDLPPPPEQEEDDFDASFDDAFAEEKKTEKKGDFASLGSNERATYALVAPSRNARKIVDLTCLGEFETCKALLNLVNLGYIRVLQPQGRARFGGEPQGIVARARQVLGHALMTATLLGTAVVVVGRIGAGHMQVSVSPSGLADAALQRVISKGQLSRIEAALGVFQVENGDVPEALDALVDAGLLQKDDLAHPWKEPYFYRRTSQGAFVLLPPLR